MTNQPKKREKEGKRYEQPFLCIPKQIKLLTNLSTKKFVNLLNSNWQKLEKLAELNFTELLLSELFRLVTSQLIPCFMFRIPLGSGTKNPISL